MAITTQDVHAAADKLQAEGQQPTLAAVRAALGGGSFTTISEAMKSWKAAQQAAAAPIREAAPAAITDRMGELAAEVWTIAQGMANDRLQSEREALELTRQEMEQAQAEAAELADQLAADLDAARAQIEQQAGVLERSTEGQRKQAELISELDAKIGVYELAIAKAEAIIPELEGRVSDQAKIIDQECAARQNAEQAKAAAEQQAAVLAAQLEAAERRASEAEARAEAATKDAAAARQAEQSARVAEHAAQARLESAAREIEQAKAAAAEARAEAKQAGEAAAELRGKLDAIETQGAK